METTWPQAAGQWGLFTAAQANRLGITRKRLTQLTAAGRVHHTETRGVYRFPGAPSTSRSTRCVPPGSPSGRPISPLNVSAGYSTAATTRSSPTWLAAHFVHELGSLHPDRLDYTVATPRRSNNPHIRFQIRDHVDWQLAGGLPITAIPQTIADLYRDGIDAGHLGDILTDACCARPPTYAASPQHSTHSLTTTAAIPFCTRWPSWAPPKTSSPPTTSCSPGGDELDRGLRSERAFWISLRTRATNTRNRPRP